MPTVGSGDLVWHDMSSCWLDGAERLTSALPCRSKAFDPTLAHHAPGAGKRQGEHSTTQRNRETQIITSQVVNQEKLKSHTGYMTICCG